MPSWHYLFGISAELCRFIRIFGRIVPIYSDFRHNCAYLFGFSAELCRFWDYFMPNCAECETIFADFMHNCAVIVPKWHYLFGISAQLCRIWDCFHAQLCRIWDCFHAQLCRIWDCFHAQLCRFVRNFGRVVPTLRLFSCTIVPICSEFRQNCADFETILCQIVPTLRLFFSRIVPSLCRISDYFCTDKIISNMCWFVLF